jgi:hypothetical protein
MEGLLIPLSNFSPKDVLYYGRNGRGLILSFMIYED